MNGAYLIRNPETGLYLKMIYNDAGQNTGNIEWVERESDAAGWSTKRLCEDYVWERWGKYKFSDVEIVRRGN